MTPIEQAIDALNKCDIEFSSDGYSESSNKRKCVIDAITALQSMQGEAVGEAYRTLTGDILARFYDLPPPIGTKLYTQPQSPAVMETCKWAGDLYGTWHTDCGNAHQFMNDGPEENDYKHCPYCGGQLSASQQGGER